jgi:hypothetical protein
MEYVVDRGTRHDPPLDEILSAYARHYPGMASSLRDGAVRDAAFGA